MKDDWALLGRKVLMSRRRTLFPQRINRITYHLRPLTETEQAVFPGLTLVQDLFKGRIAQPPAGIPRVRSGWVVWIAETYPRHYLVRLPGGASILAPYHPMSWKRVADDTPVTTLDEVRMDEKRRESRQVATGAGSYHPRNTSDLVLLARVAHYLEQTTKPCSLHLALPTGNRTSARSAY